MNGTKVPVRLLLQKNVCAQRVNVVEHVIIQQSLASMAHSVQHKQNGAACIMDN